MTSRFRTIEDITEEAEDKTVKAEKAPKAAKEKEKAARKKKTSSTVGKAVFRSQVRSPAVKTWAPMVKFPVKEPAYFVPSPERITVALPFAVLFA